MPRRHKSTKHIPFQFIDNDRGKKRYPTKREAEEAAERGMLLNPKVELSVYQGPDGGWYLTSRNTGSS